MADCSQIFFHAMDFFWFQYNILGSKPASPLSRKSMELVNPSAEPLIPDAALISENLWLSPSISQETEVDGDCTKRRSSSLELVREEENGSPDSCSRADSSSPLSTSCSRQYRTKQHRKGNLRSCKSLSELERDELKGFMDLGFIFKKGELNPRMLSMIPGLQRLDGGKEQRSVEERVRDKIARPYLSEAWLINRPDSPLLNLRIPTVATAGSDMKKHLRFWARTVASEIQQVS